MIRARDWTGHPLGRPEIWPVAFKTALSLVLNSPESMILAWGPDLSFFFNDTYFPLLGPRLSWAMGERFDKVWADGWEQAKPIIDEALAGRPRRFVDLPWTLDTDRGLRETWWSFSYSRVLDANGAAEGLFIFTNETTQRVQGDAALRRSQDELASLNAALERQVEERTKELRLYRDIVQSDTSPILAFDTSHRPIGFNRAHHADFLRVMGHAQQVGDDLLDQLPPEQAVVLKGLMDRALAGETFSVVEAFGDVERSKPTWEISYTPLRDEGGQIIGAFHHARDISARLRAERELDAVQEQLRQSQKMEAMGQLTGGVAHDFNNLLTVIKSSTDLLKRSNIAEDRRARYVTAISDTVDRAAKLTNQLLAFARRQALRPEVFAADDSVRALSDMVRTLTGSRIEIVTDLPEQMCCVNADTSQFDTALVNMAVNARDAMDGEGRLTIRVRSVDHIPGARGHGAIRGAFVAVAISDTGTGIPDALRDQIFEPFFTTKGVGHGTGLGLSQVFGFAKQSGGDVLVSSQVGHGTTFTLYLPEVSGAEQATRKEDPGAPMDGHGTRVLVVEDNADVGTFAVQTLSDLGYVPVLANNAAEALAELAKDAGRFDVVFSDVVMPGMSGIELGQEIRRLYDGLPVLLASGYSHVLARNGTYGFELLHKPYSVEQLSRLLRKVSTRQHRRRTIGDAAP
ncbi:PAS domain-containing protein [Methylobacterium adhaesivum]|jgi:PAS domain S-box-containing protein|uniref:histidine kinase n=2 Tax=Methylobacterium adhaesivum TaxID=333297 RepID=A0ABT8BDL6_9HYPH|nr:PAS domain-containing protein [Methylobacterium adhaesivum]MDN3589329.1 PAS domain-containing protein [Methylobacterium adhaesivum]